MHYKKPQEPGRLPAAAYCVRVPHANRGQGSAGAVCYLWGHSLDLLTAKHSILEVACDQAGKAQ